VRRLCSVYGIPQQTLAQPRCGEVLGLRCQLLCCVQEGQFQCSHSGLYFCSFLSAIQTSTDISHKRNRVIKVKNSHIATVLGIGTTSVQNAVKGAHLVRKFTEEGRVNTEIKVMLDYIPSDGPPKGAAALFKYLEEMERRTM
jgi:hypothetical protein